MKLSDLVKYLNSLEDQPGFDPEQVCQQHMGDLLRIVKESEPGLPDQLQKLLASYESARLNLHQFLQEIQHTREEIQALVEGMQPNYFSNSYKLHDLQTINDTDEYILSRVPDLKESVVQYMQSRMQVYSDWRHAGLVIRPGRGEWLPLLVGCDPLYLADIRPSLLQASLGQFNKEYQKRLRQYTLREQDPEGRVLRELPENQFGFGLALNFFNFKPFEIFKLYLTDIYRLLKPGGVLVLTFNDCDRAGGVELAERNYMCYTPGGMLMSLAHSLGYHIHQIYQIDAANTWLELRKPGVLTSIRGGQSLAKIVANS